jgi:hypothetical protein
MIIEVICILNITKQLKCSEQERKNIRQTLRLHYLLNTSNCFISAMTAKKFMIGGESIYHEASSPDSGYDMEMSVLGLKMEREDQENFDEDEDDEEEEECGDGFGHINEVKRLKDIKTVGEVSSMVNRRHGSRKHEGHVGNVSGNRKKRYSRARSSRARSPTQVRRTSFAIIKKLFSPQVSKVNFFNNNILLLLNSLFLCFASRAR